MACIFKYMAVSAGRTHMAVSAGRIDGKCNTPTHATVGCVSRQRIIQKHGCVSRPHKHWQSSTPNCTNHPLCHPNSPRRTHMAVSACCNDGTEENASNTCGLAVSACCLQLSNTWLCQPVAQTWLCQPAVSMLHVAEQTHVGWLFQPVAQCT